MLDVLFKWNVFSFACIAVVQPITKRLLFQQNLEWVVLKIPELKCLASFLPAVLVQDRATSTAATYLPAHKSWKTWAKKHSASYLPADPVVFTLYIVSLI